MNGMHVLVRLAWVERLGWTLVHFLWQGLSIGILYAVARQSLARRSSPHVRYLLACAALAAMMAAPLVTWELMRTSDARAATSYRIHITPPVAPTTTLATGTTTLPGPVLETMSGVQPAQFLLWVVTVWFAGAAVFWVRLAGGWIAVLRMRSVLVRPAPPEWQAILQKLGARIGLSRPVRLLVSALVQAPTVAGWLAPVILVPVGALGGLPAPHLEVLLLHELAHIRRSDYLINILQSVAEALLFYHPAVWWVSGHVRVERELCCDDMAVAISGDALTYARALAQLESFRPAHLCTVVAANGGRLSDRIARLLGHSRPAIPSSLGLGALAVAALLVAAAYGLFGQSDAHSAFQAVSIKRNTSVWSEPTRHPMGVGSKPGGPLTAKNASLLLLIQFAYAEHDSAHSLPLLASQVVGGPAWINVDRYDIEAKPSGTSDRKQMLQMLQRLLAERFKLTLHRETRELPVYDLTAAKSGLKLPAPKEASCVSMPLDGSPPPDAPGKVDCGYVAGPLSGWSTRLRLEGSKVHMADLIGKLAMVLGRPVFDRTEFAGEFDLDLNFGADAATRGLPGSGGPGDPGGSRIPRNPSLPNISAALEEQLGLKLVPGTGRVDVIVIDYAARPVAN